MALPAAVCGFPCALGTLSSYTQLLRAAEGVRSSSCTARLGRLRREERSSTLQQEEILPQRGRRAVSSWNRHAPAASRTKCRAVCVDCTLTIRLALHGCTDKSVDLYGSKGNINPDNLQHRPEEAQTTGERRSRDR